MEATPSTSHARGTTAGTARPIFFFARTVMAWMFLFVAGLLEIVWAYTMKRSDGFTRPTATVVTIAAMIASFGLLSVSMRTLPLGTAYTVWTGIGAVGAFVLGVALLGESASPARLAAAALIISGIVLMKAASPT
jgi:quaternary ammonium compound-resistance protein SugE